jgi:hypothetical protein
MSMLPGQPQAVQYPAECTAPDASARCKRLPTTLWYCSLSAMGSPDCTPCKFPNTSGVIGTTLNLPDTPNLAASANALFSWSTMTVPALRSRRMWMPRNSSGSPISGSQRWTSSDSPEHLPLPHILPPTNHHPHKT